MNFLFNHFDLSGLLEKWWANFPYTWCSSHSKTLFVPSSLQWMRTSFVSTNTFIEKFTQYPERTLLFSHYYYYNTSRVGILSNARHNCWNIYHTDVKFVIYSHPWAFRLGNSSECVRRRKLSVLRVYFVAYDVCSQFFIA